MILTIDPGSNLGWSVWNDKQLCQNGLFEYGLIDGGKHKDLYDRVNFIEDQVKTLFSKFRPSKFVIEAIQAIAQPSKSANFWLNYTYGCAVSNANRADIQIIEVNPGTLKKQLKELGSMFKENDPDCFGKNGQLNKDGVITVVNRFLGLELKKKDHNIADAIALGLVTLV